jgi:hypothetical protein
MQLLVVIEDQASLQLAHQLLYIIPDLLNQNLKIANPKDPFNISIK